MAVIASDYTDTARSRWGAAAAQWLWNILGAGPENTLDLGESAEGAIGKTAG